MITNLDYRQVNGTKALIASRGLGHLRELGLLIMQGAGNGTYYVLSDQVNATSAIQSLTQVLAEQVKEAPKEVPFTHFVSVGSLSLPEDLAQEIANLPKRCPNIRIRKIIKRLCALKPLQLTQLSKILHREPQSLRIHILSQMIKSGELVYAFPEQSAHPQQGYKTP